VHACSPECARRGNPLPNTHHHIADTTNAFRNQPPVANRNALLFLIEISAVAKGAHPQSVSILAPCTVSMVTSDLIGVNVLSSTVAVPRGKE